MSSTGSTGSVSSTGSTGNVSSTGNTGSVSSTGNVSSTERFPNSGSREYKYPSKLIVVKHRHHMQHFHPDSKYNVKYW